MSDVSFCVVIPHGDHLPGRTESVKRVKAALPSELWGTGRLLVLTGEMTCRERAETSWSWAVTNGAGPEPTHAMFLDDDVIPCPGFWDHATAAVTARPNAVVSFFANHPGCRVAAAQGLSWAASLDGLTGNGWAIPVPALREFLAWRNDSLTEHAKVGHPVGYSDDGQVNLWLMATGRRCFHTIPALIDHDVSVPSSWGADGQAVERTSVVPLPGVGAELRWDTPALLLGRTYVGNHWDLHRMCTPQAIQEQDLSRKCYAIHRAPVVG